MSELFMSKWWQQLNGFDLFVLTGAAVNLLVIGYLVVYWILH